MSKKRQLIVYKKEKISEVSKCSIVGNLRNYLLSATERVVVECLVGPVKEVFQFQRLLVGDQLIHSKSYKSMTRRNNYTVKFKPGNGDSTSCYGEIMFYVKVYLQCLISSFCSENCKCKTPKYYALICNVLERSDLVIADDPYTGATVPHLVPVTRSDNCITAIPVENILQLCFHIDCGHDIPSFLGFFPNQYEKD